MSTTVETKERRSRRDLKELAKLASDMPRHDQRPPPPLVVPAPMSSAPMSSAPLPSEPRAPLPSSPSSSRFSVPPTVLNMAPPIITTMEDPPVAQPKRKSALTGAIIGASVGLAISAIGITALVMRQPSRPPAAAATIPAAPLPTTDIAPVAATATATATATANTTANTTATATATTSDPQPVAAKPIPAKPTAPARGVVVAAPPKPNATPSLAATIPPAKGAPDNSLEDMMRKAAGKK